MADIQWHLTDNGFRAFVNGKPTTWTLTSEPPLWIAVDDSSAKPFHTDSLDNAKEYVRGQLGQSYLMHD